MKFDGAEGAAGQSDIFPRTSQYGYDWMRSDTIEAMDIVFISIPLAKALFRTHSAYRPCAQFDRQAADWRISGELNVEQCGIDAEHF